MKRTLHDCHEGHDGGGDIDGSLAKHVISSSGRHHRYKHSSHKDPERYRHQGFQMTNVQTSNVQNVHHQDDEEEGMLHVDIEGGINETVEERNNDFSIHHRENDIESGINVLSNRRSSIHHDPLTVTTSSNTTSTALGSTSSGNSNSTTGHRTQGGKLFKSYWRSISAALSTQSDGPFDHDVEKTVIHHSRGIQNDEINHEVTNDSEERVKNTSNGSSSNKHSNSNDTRRRRNSGRSIQRGSSASSSSDEEESPTESDSSSDSSIPKEIEKSNLQDFEDQQQTFDEQEMHNNSYRKRKKRKNSSSSSTKKVNTISIISPPPEGDIDHSTSNSNSSKNNSNTKNNSVSGEALGHHPSTSTPAYQLGHHHHHLHHSNHLHSHHLFNPLLRHGGSHVGTSAASTTLELSCISEEAAAAFLDDLIWDSDVLTESELVVNGSKRKNKSPPLPTADLKVQSSNKDSKDIRSRTLLNGGSGGEDSLHSSVSTTESTTEETAGKLGETWKKKCSEIKCPYNRAKQTLYIIDVSNILSNTNTVQIRCPDFL